MSVATVASGLRRWQRRVERRRLIALARRSTLLAVGAACALQLVALARGSEGAGLWLLPAAALFAGALALGLAHRTTPAAAARLLDRDLGLGAGVSTAHELETPARLAAGRHGLGALVVADVRGALGRSLASARARLQPRHAESALLVALIASLGVLLAVPTPRGESSSRPGAATAHAGPVENRALRADEGLTGDKATDPGARLESAPQTPVDAPPLAPVASTVTARAGGAGSGSGVGDAGGTGPVDPSRATTQGGAVASADATGASSPDAPEGQGSSGPTSPTASVEKADTGTPGKTTDGSSAGGQTASRGAQQSNFGVGDGSRGSGGGKGQASPGKDGKGGSGSDAPARGAGGKASGEAPAGSSASAPGTGTGKKSAQPGKSGAAAGTTPGAQSGGSGVVPQLRSGGSRLPLSPTYEAVPGVAGARSEGSSAAAAGEGGAGQSRRAGGGAASSGGGTGVAWVPPGAADVASVDRAVVLGYFGSFARVNSSGW